MITHSPAPDLFNQELQNSLKQEIKHSRIAKFAKRVSIYTYGDKGENVYFIESGQIKLVRVSPEGKECLLDIHTVGDVFGESCLAGLDEYGETAIAMEESFIKVIPRSEFFAHLTREAQIENFVKYLVVRVADHQQIITNLITIDSEHRLAETLLRLARKLGKKYLRSVVIKHKITHEELSMMVGTTRPRISQFIRKFQKFDLIEISKDRFIIVNEKNLTEYLKLSA